MSMTATGGPWSSRPCAPFLMASSGPRRRLRAVEAAYKAARRGFLERFATARQARIGHEILVGVEGFLARGGFYAIRGAVGQQFPSSARGPSVWLPRRTKLAVAICLPAIYIP